MLSCRRCVSDNQWSRHDDFTICSPVTSHIRCCSAPCRNSATASTCWLCRSPDLTSDKALEQRQPDTHVVLVVVVDVLVVVVAVDVTGAAGQESDRTVVIHAALA
jgi:hypothetical protein